MYCLHLTLNSNPYLSSQKETQPFCFFWKKSCSFLIVFLWGRADMSQQSQRCQISNIPIVIWTAGPYQAVHLAKMWYWFTIHFIRNTVCVPVYVCIYICVRACVLLKHARNKIPRWLSSSVLPVNFHVISHSLHQVCQ